MFKELIEALRRRPLLNQMWSEMEEMLGDAVDMYRPIADVLAGREKMTQATHDRVYETDKRINHLQRKIRKQLVAHLALAPGSDVPISLTLMSITKDAERVGDMPIHLSAAAGGHTAIASGICSPRGRLSSNRPSQAPSTLTKTLPAVPWKTRATSRGSATR